MYNFGFNLINHKEQSLYYGIYHLLYLNHIKNFILENVVCLTLCVDKKISENKVNKQNIK